MKGTTIPLFEEIIEKIPDEIIHYIIMKEEDKMNIFWDNDNETIKMKNLYFDFLDKKFKFINKDKVNINDIIIFIKKEKSIEDLDINNYNNFVYIITWLEMLSIEYDRIIIIKKVWNYIKSKSQEFNIIDAQKCIILMLIPCKRYLEIYGEEENELIDVMARHFYSRKMDMTFEQKKWLLMKARSNEIWYYWSFLSAFFESSLTYLFEIYMTSIESSVKHIYLFLKTIKEIIYWTFLHNNHIMWNLMYGDAFIHLIYQFEASINRVFPTIPDIPLKMFSNDKQIRARKRPSHTYFFQKHEQMFSCGLEEVKSISLVNNQSKKKQTLVSKIWNIFSMYSSNEFICYEIDKNNKYLEHDICFLPWFYGYNKNKNLERLEQLMKQKYNINNPNLNIVYQPLKCFFSENNKKIEKYIYDFIIVPRLYLWYHIKGIIIFKSILNFCEKYKSLQNNCNIYIETYTKNDNVHIWPRKQAQVNILNHTFILNVEKSFNSIFHEFQIHCNFILSGKTIDSIKYKNIEKEKETNISILSNSVNKIVVRDDWIDKKQLYHNEHIKLNKKYNDMGYNSLTTDYINQGNLSSCKFCSKFLEDTDIIIDIDYYYPYFIKSFKFQRDQLQKIRFFDTNYEWINIENYKKDLLVDVNINNLSKSIYLKPILFYFLSIMTEIEGRKNHTDLCISTKKKLHHININQSEHKEEYVIHRCYNIKLNQEKINVEQQIKNFISSIILEDLKLINRQD